MTTYSILIPADPALDVEVEEWPDGHDFSLVTLRAGIGGGFIERRQPSTDVSVWVDEEGLLKGLPRNARAETVCRYSPLVGDAFVTGAKDPDTPGLTRDAAARILGNLWLDLDEAVAATKGETV